jgi:hypothetical protein
MCDVVNVLAHDDLYVWNDDDSSSSSGDNNVQQQQQNSDSTASGDDAEYEVAATAAVTRAASPTHYDFATAGNSSGSTDITASTTPTDAAAAVPALMA